MHSIQLALSLRGPVNQVFPWDFVVWTSCYLSQVLPFSNQLALSLRRPVNQVFPWDFVVWTSFYLSQVLPFIIQLALSLRRPVNRVFPFLLPFHCPAKSCPGGWLFSDDRASVSSTWLAPNLTELSLAKWFFDNSWSTRSTLCQK